MIVPHIDSPSVSGNELSIDMAIGEEEKYECYVYIKLWRNDAETPIEKMIW